MQLGKKVIIVALLTGALLGNVVSAYGLNYYVQPGDSLYTIAARYGTTVSGIMQSNGLGSTGITPGQALKISANAGAPVITPSNFPVYTVRSGDSFFLIAQKFGISVDALKQANPLPGNYLTIGSQLAIPKSSSPAASSTTYRVKTGDTVYLIAKAYGISMDALRQANGIYNSALYPGQVLKVPATASSGSSSNSAKLNLSQNDINLLARLVTAESDGEPFEGQVAVAASILNRLNDPRYPKTIPEIVYQIDNGCYQYSPVLDGRINTPASSSAYQAVNAALSGWDPSSGASGFYNPVKTNSQWVKSQPITAVIGNHVFFSY